MLTEFPAESMLQPWILPDLLCDHVFETHSQQVPDPDKKICYKH